MHCTETECNRCIVSMGDEIFRLRATGEGFSSFGRWCEQAQEIAVVFERMFKWYLESKEERSWTDIIDGLPNETQENT